MFYDLVYQDRDRFAKVRPVSFLIKWHLTWSLISLGWANINLSINTIMICNARKSLSPVDLAWPVGSAVPVI